MGAEEESPQLVILGKQAIDMKEAADYSVDIAPRLDVLKVTEPPAREAGEKVED